MVSSFKWFTHHLLLKGDYIVESIVQTEGFKCKVKLIQNYYKKHKIVGRECPYNLIVCIHEGKPLITLVEVDFESLVDEHTNTLEIKIPSIVEAINTSHWLEYGSGQTSSVVKVIFLKEIKVIGNGKELYGNLAGVFGFRASKSPRIDDWYEKEIPLNYYKADIDQYIKHPEIVRAQITNIGCKNIHDIQFMCAQLCGTCDIDIQELKFDYIEKADHVQSFGNVIESLIQNGVDFQRVTSLAGFQGSIKSWRDAKSIDLRPLNINKIDNIEKAFKDCPILKTIDGLNEVLDKRVKCQGAFAGCFNLEEIPEKLKQVEIISAREMFDSSKISGIQNLKISNADDISSIYCMCAHIQYIDFDGHGKVFNVVKANDLFFGCQNLRRIHIKNLKLTNIKQLTQAFSSMPNLKTVILENIEITSKNNVCACQLFSENSRLEKVIFKNIRISSPIQLESLFEGQGSLVEVICDNVVIECILYVDNLFTDCSSLRKIDTSTLTVRSLNYDTYVNYDYILKDMFKNSNPHLFLDKAASILQLNPQLYLQFLYFVASIYRPVEDDILDRTVDIIQKSGVNFGLVNKNHYTDGVVSIITNIKAQGIGGYFSNDIRLETYYAKEVMLRLLGELEKGKCNNQ